MHNPVLFIQANIDRFPELDGILSSLPKDVDKQLRVEQWIMVAHKLFDLYKEEKAAAKENAQDLERQLKTAQDRLQQARAEADELTDKLAD